MDLKLLREATRPEHEATEAAVPLTQPDLTETDYVAVLQRLHGVVCAWDTVAAAEAPEAYAELVRQRRRCASLEADLQFFGASSPVPPAALPDQIRSLIAPKNQQQPGRLQVNGPDERSSERSSRFLGAMYVLEGSTLGGQYIAHHVEAALDLRPGEGDRFFRGYGQETMPKWREFQQVLLAVPDAQGDAVIDAAKGMFGIFRTWMMRGTSD